MPELLNSICLTGTAATIAEILGIEPPRSADKPIGMITRFAKNAFHGEHAERALLYNPDAIAMWLFQKYTELYEPVLRNTQIGLPMRSVMPSVTPVCFASMYTGALPEVHGIQAYVKPVLTTDTLFDALLRAGKKPAIVSTTNDSISRIFLERELDYFIFDDPSTCRQKAIELVKENRHDVIVLYDKRFDYTMHRHAPEGEESIAALRQNAAAFEELAGVMRQAWKGQNSLLAFLPDHGCHEIDGGLGSHGLAMPEDLNIMHFYGAYPKAGFGK